MKDKKKAKICFISSSGGHTTELKALKNITKQYDSFFVTEKVGSNKIDFCDKEYFIREINRKEKLFIFHFLFLTIKEFFIFIKERPNVMITTGALCSYPLAKIMKLFKKKVIYIESYARVNDLSLTGKKMYNLADLFFVQWPELTVKYEKAIYVGPLVG